MSQSELIKEYESLPKVYQREVLDFVAFLKSKLGESMISKQPSKRVLNAGGVIFGIGQGKGWIADDFDAPLDEMKEYME